MTTMRLPVLLLALALLAGCAGPATSSSPALAPGAFRPLHVVIVGDSTVCNWPLNDSLHRSGWGMHVQGYFQPALTVSNLALSAAAPRPSLARATGPRRSPRSPMWC